ncbi:p53-induced death domain-containing protein 1-like [Branchiostoma floridae]|uniref:P53-induced death domain-containing protein 1-like n=1 Tax=Branchiostoma floridae TaxID=7739 RepID=A0A9J7HP42_BRAFL|nr:p53-induced death domain-containing protein 1-like [Branchiostoma floridae]
MIPPANVEDLQEPQPDGNRGACYGFPVAAGFHTLPKTSSSVHMASQSRQHLPFRPMSCSTDTIPSTSASSHETSVSSLEYREKVYSTLARSYANILTASATEELKISLGDQWPELARRLKLKQYQIDHIVNENRSDLQGQIYNMLRCWQQRKTGEATIPELYGALKECNRLDIMHKLQAMEDNS